MHVTNYSLWANKLHALCVIYTYWIFCGKGTFGLNVKVWASILMMMTMMGTM